MNINKIKNNNGFTLIEILFTISIFIVVFIVLTTFAKNIWTYNAFIGDELASVDASRNALKTMTKEIRTAEQAATGAYVINQASNTSFSFYSDINSDGLVDKVRYFFDNGTLKKGVIKPTGTPLSYNATEAITTLAPYVTSSSIFSYYDENYDGTSAQMASPINIAYIRLIKISITQDKDINKPPIANNMTTQVSIRNLKNNL